MIKNGKDDIFNDKEVLLKVITFHPEEQKAHDEYLDLIEAISKATNQQSQVNEADRRSNDEIQVQLQKYLFDRYGFFYERKRGEYADGVRAGYIQRSQILDREIFLRMCKCCDMEPADARRMSLLQLFERQHFERTLRDPNRFEEYYFAYRCFIALNQIKKGFSRDKKNKFGIMNYGNGLQYGIYGIISACRLKLGEQKLTGDVQEIVNTTLGEWIKFEEFAVEQPDNSYYFRLYIDTETGIQKRDLNFNNYYKGRTLTKDLRTFFGIRQI